MNCQSLKDFFRPFFFFFPFFIFFSLALCFTFLLQVALGDYFQYSNVVVRCMKMTWCIVVFITCFLQLELPQKDTNFCNSGCLQFCSIPNHNLECGGNILLTVYLSIGRSLLLISGTLASKLILSRLKFQFIQGNEVIQLIMYRKKKIIIRYPVRKEGHSKEKEVIPYTVELQ